MAKKTQEHSVAKNVLNRQFQSQIPAVITDENPLPLPYRKLGTDITYIRWNNRWVYLSIIKDMVTGEALSHVLSASLELSIVQNTYELLRNTYT